MKYKIVFLLLVLAGCTPATRWLPENYKPRYSKYVGIKEHELVQQLGRPGFTWQQDGSNLRFLVYNTVVMDHSQGNYQGKNCNTIFMSGKGMIKASFYDEKSCVMR